jgi:hypothetical protein
METLGLSATTQAPRRRETVSSAAGITGSRASALSAAGLWVVNCGAGRRAQPCGIRLRLRFVVRKVGLLVRNARPTDKAIGSLGAARHCLACTLCRD